MAVIAEITIDSEAFGLGRALSSVTRDIELERIVPTSNTLIPFFWVRGDHDHEALQQGVTESGYVTQLEVVTQIGDQTLYQVEWTGEYADLINAITDSGGVILEASGATRWRFRLRFSDHEQVAYFYNFCMEHQLSIHVDRVVTLTEESLRARVFDLSSEQREAIVLAVQRGYFATPRKTDLTELSAELGISQQAISSRIRRANQKILQNVLFPTISNRQ